MAKVVKRLIREMGVVLSIEHKEAFDSFNDQRTGKTVEGQPERYKVIVLSGPEFDSEFGFKDCAINEFVIKDLDFAKKLRYLTPIWAMYELSFAGTSPQNLEFRKQ